MIERVRAIGVTSHMLRNVALALLAGGLFTWRSAKSAVDPSVKERRSMFISVVAVALLVIAEELGRIEGAGGN